MNTNQLKKFAKEARIKLITQIGVKLDFVLTQDTAELRGKSNELGQLRSKLSELGREQLIETVAYTWFNRIMALRFMDANGYNTPKVVTPLPGMSNPEILQNALAGNIEEELKLDRQRLNDLIDGRTSSSDAQTEAFKLLLVASCNKWHSAMPFMFERISDYTELLLPDDLLSDFSIVSDIRNGMSDEDCQQEELIGWLYQFYISDKKDDVFEGLKKNIKITAENIPAATQLFTPRWIVRYLVENTIGKLWLTIKPESKLRQHMPYFIEAPLENSHSQLPAGIENITDITFLDPCQGSGHILVYAFELFSKIYEEEGYNTNEIPALILKNNLFGIDIDDRAAQLASFALTMRSRKYYSRFLRNPILPNVISFDNISESVIKNAIKLPLTVQGKLIYDYRDLTLFKLTQAKNFGSLIKIDSNELSALNIQKGSFWEEQELKLKLQAEFLSKQYTIVVTNPPYKNKGELNTELQNLMQLDFPKSKGDLFACFIERGLDFICDKGLNGMVTMQAWLFIDTYKELREDLLEKHTIKDLIQIGFNSFPELNSKFALAAAFVIQKKVAGSSGRFMSLNNTSKSSDKNLVFLEEKKLNKFHTIKSSDFKYIEGTPISFEAPSKLREVFKNSTALNQIAEPRQGLATGNNDKFVRLWYEVSNNKIGLGFSNQTEAHESKLYWFPYNKGGGFKKWYGNQTFIISFNKETRDVLKNRGNHLPSEDYYFRQSITWSLIGLTFGPRFTPKGFLFDVGGSSAFPPEESIFYLLGFMASKVSSKCLVSLNPTLNYQVGDIKRLPILFPESKEVRSQVEQLVKFAIEITKEDWNRQETSWDFKKLGLLNHKTSKLKDVLHDYSNELITKFKKLHESEEKINELIIKTYGLENDIPFDVPYQQLTILQEEIVIENESIRINESAIINQFLSYGIGAIFGRYSIDKDGFILVNQQGTIHDFLNQVQEPTFLPDEDNIIPVLDDEWFTDDIVGRFKEFLNISFGKLYFEDNFKYIEELINTDIRKYFVKDFYNDHIKRYKKRPIYWMFSSPKGHFKALIYMHRYQPDLCSKMLNDYLQPFISKLEAAKQTNTLLSLREDVTAREKTLALKEVDRIELMIRDCKDYERTLFTIATQKITIDLDDGVKVNYLKFKEVLVPIKGLEKEED